jgi:hypothetical protein
MRNLRSRIGAAVVAIVLAAAAPAARADDKAVNPKMIGYPKEITVDVEGSTATTWLLLIGLGIICVGVMFKAGKRTHLD